MSTRSGLIVLAILTVGLYIAAAATGFDNVLAALWIVPAVLLVIGIVVAWRARAANPPRAGHERKGADPR